MICKMFTINGKAPTIGNTAFTGSALADPGVVMSYQYTGNSYPHYDGFSVRVAKTGTTATIDYENMCYYSTAKYDNPDPAQLNKAYFIPMSSLTYTTDPDYNFYCLKSVNIPPVSAIRQGFGYIFPCDEADYDHAGAYVIPTAEYANQELYVYVWLPDVLQAPENNAEVGLDCTTLIRKDDGLTVNLYKCDMPALNQYCYNQTYIDKLVNCHLPSGEQYFGTGNVIKNNLGDINLISASEFGQYQPVQNVMSAYDSKLSGLPSIDYVENCVIANLYNGYFNTHIKSANNSTLYSCVYQSANNCIISGVGEESYTEGSAYNSVVDFNLGWVNKKFYFNNCDIYNAPQYANTSYWIAEDCRVSGTRSYPTTGGGPDIGTYKNSYYSYVQNGTVVSSWYLEDFPTLPPVPL